MLFNQETDVLQERHLHPSVYKKYKKTKLLIQEGIGPKEFQNRGGLDLETFNALKQRRKDQEVLIEDKKEKITSKYGSSSASPISIGPCRKIKPVIGTKNALVLLTEFQDKKHSYEPQDFENLLFKKSSRSMRDYYLEASWNQLDINGKVIDHWYSATGIRADYVDEIPVNKHYPRAQKLVKETILQAKKEGNIDFSSFAKDGKIELLLIVFAGSGLDTKLNIKYIRPHQDSLDEPIELQKGIWAEKYALISELPQDDLGCFCHEVGHLLGLPDFYKEGYSPVIGNWCLMAIGDHIDNGKTPAHPNAWCKVHLGWKEPKIIEKLSEINEIPAVMDDDGTIYKIPVQGSNDNEYFLLENRQQKGFDQNLPGNGLLIWHINENHCIHLAPNSDPEHFFLTLIQSDGKNELQRDMTVMAKEGDYGSVMKKLSGDEGDPYPGITINRSFDDKSNPNSNSDKGAPSWVSVTSISDSNDKMNAKIGFGYQTKYKADLSDENVQQTGLKNYVLFLKKLIATICYDDLTPYKEGYESGKRDSIDKIKKKLDLNSYAKGYQQGYIRGYKKALEKKFK